MALVIKGKVLRSIRALVILPFFVAISVYKSVAVVREEGKEYEFNEKTK